MGTPHGYAQELIAAIRAASVVGMSAILSEAALLLEKFHETGGWAGVSSKVDAAPVTPELASELRSVLIDFVERHPDHSEVGVAIYALTRCGDSSLRAFFLREMQRHCDARRYHPMSQAEYGLTVLGDGVNYDYAPGQTDHSGYFAAVRDYLDRHRDEIAT